MCFNALTFGFQRSCLDQEQQLKNPPLAARETIVKESVASHCKLFENYSWSGIYYITQREKGEREKITSSSPTIVLYLHSMAERQRSGRRRRRRSNSWPETLNVFFLWLASSIHPRPSLKPSYSLDLSRAGFLYTVLDVGTIFEVKFQCARAQNIPF